MRVLYGSVRRFSMSLSRPSPDYWREAATLIVAAPSVRPSGPTADNLAHLTANREPFDILMLKRGSKSPFMPDGYVYPGGCVTDEDFDRDSWTAVFNKVTTLGMELVENSFQIPGPRVDMLKCNKQWTSSLLPDVAFRICALRETFEESGLLFVSHKDSFSSDAKRYSRAFPRKFVPKMHKMPERFDVMTWRKRVSADSSSFRMLCDEFDVVPNIWALFDWTNWLTPANKRLDKPPTKPKRYDTMFYVCCLESQPVGTEACTDETSDAEWKTPTDWIGEYLIERIKLFGPQIYENERLSVFPSLGELAEYIQRREPLGLIRFMPVIVMCLDGIVLVLPGDEVYPDDPDPIGSKKFVVSPLTVQAFMSSGVRCHRATIEERGYLCTVELPYGLSTSPSRSIYNNRVGTDPRGALARATKTKL